MPEYKEMLRDALRLGGFRNRLPEDETREVPKLFLRAERFLRALRRGTLLEEYKFDERWLEKNRFDLSVFTEEDIPGLVHRAARRYGMMREEGYWPPVKNTLTRDIDVFFFHPETRKSMFLYCVFNRVKPLGDAAAGTQIDLAEEDRQLIMAHKPASWPEREYVVRAADLLAWYAENQESLRVYNYYAMDTVQAWKERFSTFEHLLETVDAYSKTWSGWTLGNFGRGNKTWVRFLDWCRKTYKIELDPSLDGIKVAMDMQERERKKQKEKEEEHRREREDLEEKIEKTRKKFLGEDE